MQIAHYRVMREIGRGAMGRVYLAYDERIQRQVAVKELLLPEGLGEEERREAVERFKREAQAAGKLSHPNIVTVHSVEEDQLGNPYIVMEYLEGVTLGEALRQGPLSPERAIAIVSQVLEALEYAHQRGVVHRDIKPDNVFLLYDGRVKVADFGIARVATTSTMTQVGTVMGSPGYMSPEQVRGEIVDHRSDIFSCGVLLYELLCGVNPFSPGDATAVMYRVVHEDPLPLTRRDPSLPPYLEAVVARATAKQREARYQSAAEMRRDLLSGSFPRPAPGTVVVGAPASPTVHLAPPGPAHPTVVRPQSPVAGAPPSSRRRTSLWVLVSVLAVLLAGGGILAFFLLSSPRVQVPDLVGISEDEARSLLQKNGLSMEVEEVSLPGFEEGEVVSQVPAAGQKVDKGSRVRLEVNQGSGSVTATSREERDLSTSAVISASSILPPDVSYVNYLPQNLVDNDFTTCWAEGKPGYGLNEWVRFQFPAEVTVTRLSVIPGYLKMSNNKDRWLQNGRLKTVEIVFDDGTSILHTFADQKTYQDVRLEKPKKTRSVTVIIKDVYPGQSGPNWTLAEDTSVSEMHIFGY